MEGRTNNNQCIIAERQRDLGAQFKNRVNMVGKRAVGRIRKGIALGWNGR